MTPLEKYQADLMREDFHADVAQESAVRHTQYLFDGLLAEGNTENSFFEKIRQKFQKDKSNFIKGLYFWGGVGRGKTYIIDSFYDSLPFKEKQRIQPQRTQRTQSRIEKTKFDRTLSLFSVISVSSVAKSVLKER